MHICMITSELPPNSGGIGNYVFCLSKYLMRKGHKITIITRGSWKSLQKSSLEGADVYRLPFLPIYPFHVKLQEFYQSKLFASLHSRFDVVHTHYPLSPWVTTRLPVIVTVHTVGPSQASAIERGGLGALIQKTAFRVFNGSILRMLKRANIITAVSRQVSEDLERYYGLNKSSITTLGNGVDTSFFVPRKDFESLNAQCVLYTGRLFYRKGLTDLLQSAKYVCQKHPATFFMLTGKGPLERKLKDSARKMGLSKNFRFLGYVNRNSLLRLYQNATVYVLPSYYEGLPTSLLEAMACGLPIVTTPACNIPEVQNGTIGSLVPARDPVRLARAISTFLEDENRRRQFGDAGRRMVEATYSWKIVAQRVEECYAKALNM